MVKNNKTYKMGLDIGSTTIKLVLLDHDQIIYELYRRHHSDIIGELNTVFQEVFELFPDISVQISITGSGGVNVSRALDLPFVQEVIAETEAIHRYHPETDIIIELGGEDAKITYLKPVPEQRMNGTCAGGTGAFIDQMASLLQTDASGLDQMASEFETLYPIASRCGVFAKSDLQPLINEGASKSDLAASVFQSVVNQTIAGLACGRPIRGHVIFLGGPLYFLPSLRDAFVRTLNEQVSSFTTPENAQLYVAIGAALLSDHVALKLSDVCQRFAGIKTLSQDISHIKPLFADDTDKAAFDKRHAQHKVPRLPIEKASGDCFLGIDAGSTTTKGVLVDANGQLIYTFYESNKGNPIKSAFRILSDVYSKLPETARIARSCVTGYGEHLIKAAFHLDEGEIETMAHYKAAAFFCPDVDFIIDIGGQDMKCMRVKEGVLDSIMVNEACSSGCGSFIQTFAESLNMQTPEFAKAALSAGNPVDLGTRCTVFMNSRVKQAQKEGASVGDISAGLSFSVVRNALYKVIKIKDPSQMGKHVVVQGGTFLNDAILRSFERVSGREVIRPNIAGLMGAFGSALLARERFSGQPSRLIAQDELAGFKVQTERSHCNLCTNNCQLTISSFSNGERFVSGNRCERGAGIEISTKPLPNLFQDKLRLVFNYKPLPSDQAPRGELGIPRALNMYENYPFWHTVLSELGFRVILSRRSTAKTFAKGMDSIPSESVCYPAKLVHGHVVDLIERGIKHIFYPDISYEEKHNPDANNHYNCPIVVSYPEVIKNNVEQLQENQATLINPFLSLAQEHRHKLSKSLAKSLADFGVSEKEARRAVNLGFAEDARFKAEIRAKGKETVAWLRDNNLKGVVLAGRPYHIDQEVNHGMAEMITGLGLAVLTEDSVADPKNLQRPLRVVDQWAYHTRLYEAAAFVATQPHLELVQLNSFGCGLDAVTTDQVQEILEANGRIFTVLKIDEVSNLGAARIRIRSLKAAMDERARDIAEKAAASAAATLTSPAHVATETNVSSTSAHHTATGTSTAASIKTETPIATKSAVVELSGNEQIPGNNYTLSRVPFTKEMKKKHTILAPQMSPIHFRLVETVLNKHGYQTKVLDKTTSDDVETGLKYVNNDACYPSIIVVGQLIAALQSGQYDTDNCSLFITQTGGGCRATNYVAFLRKALKESGFAHVPVVALSANGIEKNPGFKFTLPLIHQTFQTLVIGDVLQTVLLRVRPYETEEGAANRLYHKWDKISREYFADDGYSRTLDKKLSYGGLIQAIVKDFDRMPLLDMPRKPRVGLVGEILVKFHPDANNHAINVIESEGCEAVMPGLLDFFLYCVYNGSWKNKQLGTGRKRAAISTASKKIISGYRHQAAKALAATKGKFIVPEPIDHLAERVQPVLSLGNDSGEGWFLTAEMLELIAGGVPNIICAQPFACLPNHVTGKGMIKALRRLHPEANIVPIDYDPGASEVNQLNRIKLMIATAFRDQTFKGNPTQIKEEGKQLKHLRERRADTE